MQRGDVADGARQQLRLGGQAARLCRRHQAARRRPTVAAVDVRACRESPQRRPAMHLRISGRCERQQRRNKWVGTHPARSAE